MTIVVGSTSRSKASAVRQVAGRAFPGAGVVAVDVPSGVAAQPTSREEAIRGALARARGALGTAGADLGVGIEGGVEVHPEGVFLSAWCAALDREGTAGLGSGMRIRLPDDVARRVLAGEELGAIVDAMADDADAHEALGAIGVLTRGLVTREEALAHAVAAALAAFLTR